MTSIPQNLAAVNQESVKNGPPASNTGVKPLAKAVTPSTKAQLEVAPREGLNEPQVSTGTRIDWLSVTLKDWSGPTYPDGLTNVWVDELPKNGYDRARRFADGRLELTHSTRSDMGTHIIWPGEALENALKQAKLSDLDVLRFYQKQGAKITRIDVALDAWNSGLELSRLHEAVEAGHATTNCKSSSIVKSSGEFAGTTVYVGSRQSEAFTRYYDKAAEQGVAGDWLRFELQLKASKAEKAADELLNSFAPDRYITALICGHCDFPTIAQWSTIMSEEPTIITRAKKTETDTLSWLMDVCAPSLARQIIMSIDDDVQQRFNQRVENELERLIEQQLRQQQQ